MKNIPYIIILFLIIVISLKDCGGGKGRNDIIESDTTLVTTIDSLNKVIEGMQKVSEPTEVKAEELEPEVITEYITVTENCDKPHLSDKGIDLIKHRNYKDTVQIKGYFVSYDASVLGELQGIELFLNGNVPMIRQTTLRAVTNTVEKKHSLSAYFNYNRSAQVGLEYSSKRFGYSLNYDLEYKTKGVQIKYTPLRW